MADENTGLGALLASLGGETIGKLFGSYAGVGQAMPEAYGANAPIMDPLVTAPLSIAKMVTGPGDLIKPNPYPAGSESWHWYEGQRDKGMTEWGASTAMNLAGTSAPFAPVGAAGVFGGRLAKTADLGALRTAEEMHAAGADRGAIWDKTGWFRGEDGKWRFEIPDDKARMNPNKYGDTVPNSDWGRVSGQMWHPELYDAYPDLRNATGMFEKSQNTVGGSYSAPGLAKSGEETIHIQAPNTAAARSVGLHELQHAIQEREGFASGGNPAMFSQGEDAKLARDALSYRREIEKLDPSLTPKQKDDIIRARYREIEAEDFLPSAEARDIAHDVEGNPEPTLRKVMELYGTDVRTSPYTPKELYRQVPGEVEARNVQTRADWTPEQRKAMPPWESVDVKSRPILNSMFGSRVGLLEGGKGSQAMQMSVPEAPFGIRAYHGSPHDFDRFDMSKIGTGEGAQAYGHGLYFAEREGVARSYKDALGVDPRDKLTEMIQGWTGYRQPGEQATDEMVRNGLRNNTHAALNRAAEDPGLVRDITTYINGHADDLRSISPEGMQALRRIDKALPPPSGHMYEVNIDADPAHFLDWDRPISGQHSRVEGAAFDLLSRGMSRSEANHIMNTGTGQDVMRRIARPSYPIRDSASAPWRASGAATLDEALAAVDGDKSRVNTLLTPDPAYTAEALKSQRVPGVRYFDEGSRAPGGLGRARLESSISTLKSDIARLEETGGGNLPRLREKLASEEAALAAMKPATRNYVVFNDKIISILRKYGLVGAVPGGVGALAAGGAVDDR